MKRFRVRFLNKVRSRFLSSEYEFSALDLQWAIQAVRIQCRYCGLGRSPFQVHEVALARKGQAN